MSSSMHVKLRSFPFKAELQLQDFSNSFCRLLLRMDTLKLCLEHARLGLPVMSLKQLSRCVFMVPEEKCENKMLSKTHVFFLLSSQIIAF